MKNLIIILLFLSSLNAATQNIIKPDTIVYSYSDIITKLKHDKMRQDSIGDVLIQAGGSGTVGLIITTTAPLWLLGVNDANSLKPLGVIAGLQTLVGCIVQIVAWQKVRNAGFGMGGKIIDSESDPNYDLGPPAKLGQ